MLTVGTLESAFENTGHIVVMDAIPFQKHRANAGQQRLKSLLVGKLLVNVHLSSGRNDSQFETVSCGLGESVEVLLRSEQRVGRDATGSEYKRIEHRPGSELSSI